MPDAENDGGAAELHSQGRQAAAAEQVGLEADERTGELRGNQRTDDAEGRDSRKVLPRAARQEGESQAGVYRYVWRGQSVMRCLL